MTSLNPNEELQRLLSAHGLASVEEQGWLFPRGDMPGLRAVWNSKAETGRAGGRLDVHAYLGGDVMIEECFAGNGGADRDDFGFAMANFAINSLHVLLAGLYGVVDPEQVVVERWLVGGKGYQAYVGNFGMRASSGVQPQVPDGLFSAIETAILEASLGGDTHWVRAFAAQFNGGMTFEALLDNATWGRGLASLQGVHWAKCDGYNSVRNFILLRAV